MPELPEGRAVMSDYLFSNSLLMLESAMNFQWTKMSVINNNIVNAETPNYKTQYVTFEEALRDRLRSSARLTQPVASMRSVLTTARPSIHVAVEESTRMDDNGVNVAEQTTEATRNALQMQYTMDAINSNLSVLRSVIRGQ